MFHRILLRKCKSAKWAVWAVIGNLLADFYSDKGLKYEQSMQKKLRLVSR